MPKNLDKLSLPLLLEFATELPSSPKAFARLSYLIEDEDTALDYIATIVKMDPGLATHILRITNSAYYGKAVRLNDIESAIARIGFVELRRALAVTVAHDSFYQALPCYGITATEFADSCIAVAVAAEVVAKRTGSDLNAPYITGLLHEIGKLAINLYLEKLGQTVDLSRLGEGRSIHEVEFEALGTTSWQVGSALLQHWQFDPEVWQAIKQQSSPQTALRFPRPTAQLSVSIWIGQQLEKRSMDAEVPPHIHWAFNKLGLHLRDRALLFDETRFEYNSRQNMLAMLL